MDLYIFNTFTNNKLDTMKKYLHYRSYILILVLVLSFLTGCNKKTTSANLKYFCQNEVPQQTFGLKKLSEVVSLEQVNNPDEANILLISAGEIIKNQNFISELKTITSEGFSIKKLSRKKIAIISSDMTGSMYGILDVAEQIQMGKTIKTIKEKSINPKIPFRAIKFNLPWNSYRVHESLQLHYDTVRDIEFWTSFLDMMAVNHFNALTLWNLHPFPYMIRATNYPEACPFSDEELVSCQKFWH
jgi:hypothetical protein